MTNIGSREDEHLPYPRCDIWSRFLRSSGARSICDQKPALCCFEIEIVSVQVFLLCECVSVICDVVHLFLTLFRTTAYEVYLPPECVRRIDPVRTIDPVVESRRVSPVPREVPHLAGCDSEMRWRRGDQSSTSGNGLCSTLVAPELLP